MYGNGVIVGKFYPFHMGHYYLIETGLKNINRRLTIFVCDGEETDIPASLRASWIQKSFPHYNVDVRVIKNDLPDNDSYVWAQATIGWLGGKPDVVFTSENYGWTWAKEIGCDHFLVDLERKVVPISGTLIRSKPLEYLQFLPPIVRAFFVKRILIVGAESTGTTTLAQDLAKEFKTFWVPEYGREYTETNKISGAEVWSSEEFVHIAETQNKKEDLLAETANKVLFVDTDSLATALWHERYFDGERNPEVEELARGRNYDLIILTSPIGVEVERDGYREGGRARLTMHERFKEVLTEAGREYLEVIGSKEQRIKLIAPLIREMINGRQ